MNMFHVAFDVPVYSVLRSRDTLDAVTGHESHQGHAKLSHACRCSLTCQWSHTFTSCCPHHLTLCHWISSMCINLQNIINKCLHRVLFPFSFPLLFPTNCPISHFTNSPSVYLSYYIFSCSFISFSSFLFLPHFHTSSLFSILTATWTACHKGGQSG